MRAIAPYQAGKPISEVAREFGLDEATIVKLASNENPFGMPESAQHAMPQAAADLGRYPDANGFELKQAISAYDVPADWITLGNGSNDILEIAAHAFVQKGQSVVYSQYSFAVYALATQGVGARAIVVPAVNTATTSARCCAPSTPTRAWSSSPTRTTRPAPSCPPPRLEAFLDAVPANVVVVLDEAYNEYLAPEQQYDSVAWVRTLSRTCSSRAPSRRPTAWPACASALRSRSRP